MSDELILHSRHHDKHGRARWLIVETGDPSLRFPGRWEPVPHAPEPAPQAARLESRALRFVEPTPEESAAWAHWKRGGPHGTPRHPEQDPLGVVEDREMVRCACGLAFSISGGFLRQLRAHGNAPTCRKCRGAGAEWVKVSDAA